MKKKILFVMESLRIGGAEKSLVTLLPLLDKEKYDIDLLLFRHGGEFMEQIPENVHLLPLDEHAAPMQNIKTAFLIYLKRGDFTRFFHSFSFLLECFISKYILKEPEYYGWHHLKHIHTRAPDRYDVAVGYLEKKTTYYIGDMTDASRKIAFMHTDYDAIPHDEKLDSGFYQKLDYLVVISEHTAETMKRHFPFMENKIRVIKNMISPALISKMADSPAPELECCATDTIKIVTVARLTQAKNIDGAVNICKRLTDKGYSVKWFIIGDGEEKNNLEKMISQNKLENHFFLLGSKTNPYPYMAKCDIYVQPSRWEGYGITVAEAKCLCKPIVVSDIPEFREQIQDTVLGLIGTDEEDISVKISQFITDSELNLRCRQNLKKTPYQNKELSKFDELLS